MITYKLKIKKILYQGKDKLEEWVMTWRKIKQGDVFCKGLHRCYNFFFLNVFEFSETNTKKEKDSYIILLII